MSIKLATHKHYRITGLYRHSKSKSEIAVKSWIDRQLTEVDFWDKYRNKWEQSYSVERADLVELTDEEKAAL